MEAAPTVANMRNLALAELRASTDALTGLANRRAAGETAHRMVAQAGRTVAPLAAILFDLDHFKQINDTLRPPEGRRGARRGRRRRWQRRARERLRRALSAARSSSSCSPARTPRAPAWWPRSCATAISRLEVAGVDRAITASFGVAAVPEHAGDANELLRQADRALYVAKADGRDRVELARPASAEAALERA